MFSSLFGVRLIEEDYEIFVYFIWIGFNGLGLNGYFWMDYGYNLILGKNVFVILLDIYII